MKPKDNRQVLPGMFSDPPAARAVDQEAADASKARRHDIRIKVLAIFEHHGPLTDKELIGIYRKLWGQDVPESSIRTRRNELTKETRLVPFGERDRQQVHRLWHT